MWWCQAPHYFAFPEHYGVRLRPEDQIPSQPGDDNSEHPDMNLKGKAIPQLPLRIGRTSATKRSGGAFLCELFSQLK